MSSNITNSSSYCVAIHVYQANRSDELGLNPGEVVKVSKKADDGWWYGQKIQPSEETKGWFPANFTVEPVDIDLSAKAPLRYARAAYEYKSQEIDELDLHVGDLITVIQTEEDEGWHRGVLNGKLGLFPANFVVLLPKSDYEKVLKSSKQTTPSGSPEKDSYLKVLYTPDRRSSLAVFGNVLQDVEKRLKEMNFSENAIKENTKIIGKAIVAYDYVAQQPDELSLKKGSKIDIISKDEEGWWTGIDEFGKTGVFPFNFVKETFSDDLSTSSEPKPVISQQQLPTIQKSSSAEKLSSAGSGPVPESQNNREGKPVAVRKTSNAPRPTMDTSVPPVVGLLKPSMLKMKDGDQNSKAVPLKPILPKPNSSNTITSDNSATSPPPPVLPKPVFKPGGLPAATKSLLSKQISQNSLKQPENQESANTSEIPKPIAEDKSDSTSPISAVQFGVKSLLKKLGGPNSNNAPAVNETEKAEAPKLTHFNKSRPTMMGKKRPPSHVNKTTKTEPATEDKHKEDIEEEEEIPKKANPIPSLHEIVSPATVPSENSEVKETSSPSSSFQKLTQRFNASSDSTSILKKTASPPPPPHNKPKNVPTLPASPVKIDKQLLSSTEELRSLPDKTILSPISLPSNPSKDYTTKELYKLFYGELVRLRTELNEKLREEKELSNVLSKEVDDLKRLLNKS